MNEEVIAGYFPSSRSMPRGKTFKPSKALRNKYWFTAVSMAVVFWLEFVNFWTIVGNIIWLIPALIGIAVYMALREIRNVLERIDRKLDKEDI
jgi:hypothetical protein